MSGKSAAEVPDVKPHDELSSPRARDLRVRIVREVAEFASVRGAWLQLLTDQVAADPDFLEAALAADDQILRPHVVVLERAGEVEAMLVGRVERLEFGVRAGYRKLYSPWVTAITIVQGGILGDVDEATFRLLLGGVRESLAEGEADVAIFRYLPLDSALYRIASAELPFLSRQHVADSEVHWELVLPESVDDILRALSSSTRQTVNRYTRKLEREYGDRISMRVFTDPAELDDFFRDVEPISAKTYQRALGVSFGDTPTHRERTRVAMERGWFRGYVLYLHGVPCAFHHGELYQGRFRHGRPGYDPDLGHLRVGTYLLLLVFGDLIERHDARIVDYGIGDADYKRRFGTRSWREGNVVVYAPTLRAATVNLLRTSLLAAVRLAKRIFGKGEVYRRIKRGWRRRLTSAESRTP
jgi:CelD/BcsL family acetyltransferase involved in cellulose biosynthesis